MKTDQAKSLDGGESGGDPALSADAAAFCLRMLCTWLRADDGSLRPID